MGPQYIKKEDALDFFKNYLRGRIIIGFFYTIISFFLILFFSREINSLSNQINSADIYLYTGTLLMILGTITYWVFIAKSFSKSFKDDFFNKIKQYDDKEMLNWSKLIDSRNYWLGGGLYILGISLGILFYMLPILK